MGRDELIWRSIPMRTSKRYQLPAAICLVGGLLCGCGSGDAGADAQVVEADASQATDAPQTPDAAPNEADASPPDASPPDGSPPDAAVFESCGACGSECTENNGVCLPLDGEPVCLLPCPGGVDDCGAGFNCEDVAGDSAPCR